MPNSLYEMRGLQRIMVGVYNYHDSQQAHLTDRIRNSVGMELVTAWHHGGSLKYVSQ